MSHFQNHKMSNLFCFFTDNCTLILKHLDMGINKCFKWYYRKWLVEAILVNNEKKSRRPFKRSKCERSVYIAGVTEKEPKGLSNRMLGSNGKDHS